MVAKVKYEGGEVIVVASALFWTLFAILWSFVTNGGVAMDGSDGVDGGDGWMRWKEVVAME